MSLTELETSPALDTSTDSIIKDFYVPALGQSVTYNRGVGYFTSRWLSMAAEGLSAFAANGGRARFIVSPYMSSEDWAALAHGAAAKDDPSLLRTLEDVVEDLPNALEAETLSVLAWMVADGLIEFRVAIPVDFLDGDFHDKFGIFSDATQNSIGFHGSQNDSAKAFRNYESISIFYSWEDAREAKRVQQLLLRFNRLWGNQDPNLQIFSLPQAITRKLAKFTELGPRPYTNRPSTPKNKWRHQAQALERFLERKNGVLEMATGTGKTRTALNILAELFKRGEIDSVVITMSGTDLLQQWQSEISDRTDIPVFRHFQNIKEGDQFFAVKGDRILLSSRQQLKGLLPYLSDVEAQRTLIICDEVHGFGSPTMIRDLSGQIKRCSYRLGLSATPEREYDQDGNDFIEREIGKTVFEFTPENAILRGILCEFDYLPLEYTLSDDDKAQIKRIIARHHAKKKSGEIVSDEALYRDIARVRKTSITKIPPFASLIESRPDILQRCLLFVETAAFGAAVQPVLMDARVPFQTYYQSDKGKNLKEFAVGNLDCLLSCHRLSEGIDIKSVDTIVLFASSRAKLETIQRLGRCLRIDPGNPVKRALVVDFVEENADHNSADTERREWFNILASIRTEESHYE